MLARAGSLFFLPLNARPGIFEFREAGRGKEGVFSPPSSWDCGIDGKGRGGTHVDDRV